MILHYDPSDYGTDFFYADPFLIWRKNSSYTSPTAISKMKVHHRGTKQAKRLILKMIIENSKWLYVDMTKDHLSYNDKLPNFLYNLKPDDGNQDIERNYIDVNTLRDMLDQITEGEERWNIQC